MIDKIYNRMNDFAYEEPIDLEMSSQEQVTYLHQFAQQNKPSIRRTHTMRKAIIVAACVAVLGATAAIAVSSAVGRSKIAITGGDVNVVDVNQIGTVASEVDAASYLLTLDELLYDFNGFGLMSFSITDGNGCAVQKDTLDLSALELTLDLPTGGYGLGVGYDGDLIASLQASFFTTAAPQNVTVTFNGTEYQFNDIQVTETSGLCWEADGLIVSPLGVTLDRYCTLHDAIESFLFGDNCTGDMNAAIATIRYKDGTEVECSCKGFGGTKPTQADDPDRELWRCQLQLHPVELIEEQDLSTQYCINIENLESITIAGITYDAADAQTVTN